MVTERTAAPREGIHHSPEQTSSKEARPPFSCKKWASRLELSSGVTCLSEPAFLTSNQGLPIPPNSPPQGSCKSKRAKQSRARGVGSGTAWAPLVLLGPTPGSAPRSRVTLDKSIPLLALFLRMSRRVTSQVTSEGPSVPETHQPLF